MPRPIQRLGWRWSRSKDFSGPDQRPARDTFMELQRFMTWPHVGLRFSGVYAMTTTFTTSIVPMSLISTGSVTTDLPDPYSLYRSITVHCQVPQEFEYWMVVGAATFRTAGVATDNTIRSFGFSINGTVTEEWVTHGFLGASDGALRSVVPIMERVKKGDTINVCAASSSAGEDLVHARAYLVFYPLT